MENVRLEPGTQEQAMFFVADRDGMPLAKLMVDIVESDLVINGIAALKGEKGSLRSKLFQAMISYAREHYLKIVATNRLVYDTLKVNPEQEADVWDEYHYYSE